MARWAIEEWRCQRGIGLIMYRAIRAEHIITKGKKIGNAHLKWAFSEAATLFLRNNPQAQKLLSRLEKTHDNGKALSILAHQLGRAVYLMLKRQVAFDMNRFLQT